MRRKGVTRQPTQKKNSWIRPYCKGSATCYSVTFKSNMQAVSGLVILIIGRTFKKLSLESPSPISIQRTGILSSHMYVTNSYIYIICYSFSPHNQIDHLLLCSRRFVNVLCEHLWHPLRFNDQLGATKMFTNNICYFLKHGVVTFQPRRKKYLMCNIKLLLLTFLCGLDIFIT